MRIHRQLLPLVLILSACAGGSSATTTSASPATTTSSSTTIAETTSTSTPGETTTTISYPVREGVVVETIVAELDAAAGGLSVDSEGNLYSADFGSAGRRARRVYKVTPQGEVSIYADIPGMFTASGNVFGPDGKLYQSSFRSGEIYSIEPDGTATALPGRYSGPVGLAITDDGTIYVAECSLGKIARLDPDGVRETFASDDRFQCPNGLTFDDEGNLYMADFGNGNVFKITPDATVTLLATLPGNNNGHLKFHNGELIVAARGASQIYAVSLRGDIELIAGSGEFGLSDGPGPEAAIGLPNAIAIGDDGTIYINHANNTGNSNEPTGLRAIRVGG